MGHATKVGRRESYPKRPQNVKGPGRWPHGPTTRRADRRQPTPEEIAETRYRLRRARYAWLASDASIPTSDG